MAAGILGSCTEDAGLGTFTGILRDAESGQPVANAAVSIVKGSSTVQTVYSDANGVYTAELESGTGYQLQITASGYIPATYSNATTEAHGAVCLETVHLIPDTRSGYGNVAGTIYNATTGQPIAGASLTIRSNINSTSGASVLSLQTDGQGDFLTQLSTGYFTLSMSMSGFTSTSIPLICIGNQVTYNQSAALNPSARSPQWRFVLIWGSTPADLDAHLTGPQSGTESRFQCYFVNNLPLGFSDSSVYMDVSDNASEGPETITIREQRAGTYRYYVHNFTDGLNASGTTLSRSHARVQVYCNGSLYRTFNVPAGQGIVWTVFELGSGGLTPINTLADAYSVMQ